MMTDRKFIWITSSGTEVPMDLPMVALFANIDKVFPGSRARWVRLKGQSWEKLETAEIKTSDENKTFTQQNEESRCEAIEGPSRPLSTQYEFGLA